MWTCAPCGTPNEPHAIFCAACGAMRCKAPVRDALAPPEPVADWPIVDAPEFKGTIAGFTAVWVLASLGGGLAAWLLSLLVSSGFNSSLVLQWGEFALRLTMNAVFALVWGCCIGTAQSWVLRRRIRRPGWNGWILATVTASVVVSIAAALLPQTRWTGGGQASRLPWMALLGVAGGGFVGLLQSRVLARLTGSGGWTAWWLVSAGANALGNVAGASAWEALFDRENITRSVALAGFAHTIVDVTLTTLLTGWPLGRMLRRRCAPFEIAPPQNEGAISR